MFFLRLAHTCESVWQPNASLYASSTLLRLRLLAGPFGQGFTETPTPQEIPIPSVGGVWILSGTAHCLFEQVQKHILDACFSNPG